MEAGTLTTNAVMLYTAAILALGLAVAVLARMLRETRSVLNASKSETSRVYDEVTADITSLKKLLEKDLSELPQRQNEFEESVRKSSDAVKTHFDQTSEDMQQRFNELDDYLRKELLPNLQMAMKGFDNTVADVLGEMKSELKAGVSRIEKMETTFGKSGPVGQQLEASDARVNAMLGEGKGEGEGKGLAEKSAKKPTAKKG